MNRQYTFVRSCLTGIAMTLAGITSLHAAAAPDYDKNAVVNNTYQKSKGAWDTASNWDLKHVPIKNEVAWVGHRTTVTLSNKAPAVGEIRIGGAAPSELTIARGGELRAERQIRVFRNINGNEARLNIDGGYLRAGADEDEKFLVRLFIGSSTTFSSTGQVRITDGTYEGGILVGSPLPNTGVGTLSIIGSAPKVRGIVKSRDNLVVYPKSTLEFILDEKGVASLNYSNAKVELSEGALVRVDGSAYKGPSATLPLILTKKINTKATLECIGFPDKQQAAIVKTPEGLALRVRR